MYLFRFRQQIAWWIQPRFTAVWWCCVLHPFLSWLPFVDMGCS